jgi:nucleoside-diphosphate-sugar epimerase
MRIVVLGANGQVGAEVCLRLSGVAGIDLVPVSRTRVASAFLRARGVPVWHADPTDPAAAAALFAGADLIANFALAGGVGRAARKANEAILHAMVSQSPPGARLVFFSTLAIHGAWDAQGNQSGHSYGDLKRRNEHYFDRQTRHFGRRGWTLRLGHVTGSEQGLTAALRQAVRAGTITVPDPDRASNTTSTATICDAIMSIAEDRSSPPGRYDLVNVPQWSWRQVLTREAAETGAPLRLVAGAVPPKQRVPFRRRVFGVLARWGVRPMLERLLSMLPGDHAERIRSDYRMSRAASEIAQLSPPDNAPTDAAFWPELDIRPLAGLQPTEMLDSVFPLPSDRHPRVWADAIEPQR